MWRSKDGITWVDYAFVATTFKKQHLKVFGIRIKRGTGQDATLLYNDINNSWEINGKKILTQ